MLSCTIADTKNRVLEIVVVHLYYCPFLRSSVDKHSMPSNSFGITVTPGFYYFCNYKYSEWHLLTKSGFSSSDSFELQLLMTSASGGQLLMRVLLMRLFLMIFITSFLQMHSSSDAFLQHKLPFCKFHCSSFILLEPTLALETLKFLSMVLQTWTNISISNWHFLIPCYHQNSKWHCQTHFVPTNSPFLMMTNTCILKSSIVVNLINKLTNRVWGL